MNDLSSPKLRDCLRCKYRTDTLRTVKELRASMDLVYVRCEFTPLLVKPSLKMRCPRFKEEKRTTAKCEPLDSERINDDLYVYLTQTGRKKFIVTVMDDVETREISSHSRLERAEISFDATIESLKHLREAE